MLESLIQEHALDEAVAGAWDTVAAKLNALTTETRNTRSWTLSDLIAMAGVDAAALVGGTLQAAGASNPIFAGAWIALNVTGLQLHTDERQAMIDMLATAGAWPDAVKSIVKSAGVSVSPVIETTADKCKQAWDLKTTINEKNKLNSLVNEAQAAVASFIASSEKTPSGEDVRAKFVEQFNLISERN